MSKLRCIAALAITWALVVPVSGVTSSAAAGEELKLIGGKLDFGEVVIGNKPKETLTFQNMYSVKYEPPAKLTKKEGGAAFTNAGETECSGDVPSGSECKIVVEFSPTAKEKYKAGLEIFYENPCTNMKEKTEVTVEGKGK
jgi:hypothetical protein